MPAVDGDTGRLVDARAGPREILRPYQLTVIGILERDDIDSAERPVGPSRHVHVVGIVARHSDCRSRAFLKAGIEPGDPLSCELGEAYGGEEKRGEEDEE